MADQKISFEPDGATGRATCASCGRAIRDEYWNVGEHVFCPECKAQQEERDRAPHEYVTGTLLATLLGTVGGLAGAIVWYLLVHLTGWIIGYAAILVGWLVGKGVAVGSGHRGGRWYQVLAVVITYSSMALAQGAVLLASDGGGSSLDDMGVAKYPVALIGGFLMPLLMFKDNAIWALINVAITYYALARAWRMNRRVTLAFSGPHHVGSGAAEPPPTIPPPLPGSEPPSGSSV